jgi:hypothetical protein
LHTQNDSIFGRIALAQLVRCVMSSTTSFVNPRRAEVLRLYKKLFRARRRLLDGTVAHDIDLHRHANSNRGAQQAAEKMPTNNRVGWVKAKTQRDFRKYQGLTDEKEIDLHLIVGETNLDSVEIQAAHLTKMFNTDWDAEANRAFQPPPGLPHLAIFIFIFFIFIFI